jgi:uncharacterized membrane protein
MSEQRNLMIGFVVVVVVAAGIYYFTKKDSGDKKQLSEKKGGEEKAALDSFGLPNTRTSAIASILVLARKGNASIKDEETLKQLTVLSDAEVIAYNKMLNTMLNEKLVQELKEVKSDKVATVALLSKHGITEADMKLGASALGKMVNSNNVNSKK